MFLCHNSITTQNKSITLFVLIHALSIFSLICCQSSSQKNSYVSADNEDVRKIFLTKEENYVFVPQQQFQQSQSTVYTVEGQGFQSQDSLSVLKQYPQVLPLADHDQPVEAIPNIAIDFYFTVDSVEIMHTINSSKVLSYYVMEYQRLKLRAQENISDELIIPKGIKAIQSDKSLVWGVQEVILAEQIPISSPSQIRRISTKKVSFQNQLSQQQFIQNCQISSSTNFVCFTPNKIFLLSNTPNQNKLDVLHIFSSPHQCLVNVYQFQSNMIALCDCQDGCYNYEILESSMLREISHVRVGVLGSIVSMEITPERYDSNIVVAGPSLAVLYKWTPMTIQFYDSFNAPLMPNSVLTKVCGNSDTFIFIYSNKTAYINILYTEQQQHQFYEPINKILENLFIKVNDNKIYEILQNYTVQIRNINPFNLLIRDMQQLRNITISSFQPNISGQPRLQVITLLIKPVEINSIYIEQQIIVEDSIMNDDPYSIELSNLFAWSPIGHYSIRIQSDNSIRDNDKNITEIGIKLSEDHRILSLYSLRPCAQMKAKDSQSFQRTMLSPDNKLYIEQCRYNDQLKGYICTLKSIQQNPIYESSQQHLQKRLKILFNIGKTYIWSYNYQLQNQQVQQQFYIATEHHCYKIQQPIKNPQSIFLLDENILLFQITKDSLEKLIIINLKKNVRYVREFQGVVVLSVGVKINKMEVYVTYAMNINGNNTSLRPHDSKSVFIDVVGIQLFQYRQISTHIKATFQIQGQSPYQRSMINKFYKNYFLMINATHFCKYSTFSIVLQTVYCLQLDDDNLDTSDSPNSLVRAEIVENYLLIVYKNEYRILNLDATKFQAQIDHRTHQNIVYDLIMMHDLDTLILGVDKQIRSYFLEPELEIGGFPARADLIRDTLRIVISPSPSYTSQQQCIPSQVTSVNVLYKTLDIGYAGKHVKFLKVPFSTNNYYLQIYETMFIGSIFKYFLSDTFNEAIQIQNHFEPIEGEDGKIIPNQLQNQLQANYYSLLLQDPKIQDPITLIFCNQTDLIIVPVSEPQKYKQMKISDNIPKDKVYTRYLQAQSEDGNELYILIGKQNIGYLEDTGQQFVYSEITINISQISSPFLSTEREKQREEKYVLYFLQEAESNCKELYFVNVTDDPYNSYSMNFSKCIKAMAAYKQIIFYLIKSDTSEFMICFHLVQKNISSCENLEKVIASKYYEKSVVSYNKIQPLYLVTTDTATIVNFLLLSTDNSAIHLDLQLSIDHIKVEHSIYRINGCYVGYYEQKTLKNVLKIKYSTSYSPSSSPVKKVLYLIFEYELEDRIYLSFYNYTSTNSNQTASYCNQILNSVVSYATQDDPYYGSLTINNTLHNFLTPYNISEKLYFILNYSTPVQVTYIIIRSTVSEDSLQSLGFYSKFLFELQETNPIFYTCFGFGTVILVLVLMKILSCLCDRGVIKWTSTNSSDSDINDSTKTGDSSQEYMKFS